MNVYIIAVQLPGERLCLPCANEVFPMGTERCLCHDDQWCAVHCRNEELTVVFSTDELEPDDVCTNCFNDF